MQTLYLGLLAFAAVREYLFLYTIQFLVIMGPKGDPSKVGPPTTEQCSSNTQEQGLPSREPV